MGIKVRANCEIVREAVEEFATRNNGVYASDVGVDETPDGDTVVDLLPGGLLTGAGFAGNIIITLVMPEGY